jgi:hypothetical protein
MRVKVNHLETQLSVLSELPLAAGFKNGTSSAMTSRTMMLAELRLLLAALPASAGVAQYRTAIVDDNLLLKRSAATRRATAKHLIELTRPSCRTCGAPRWRWNGRTQG